MITGAIAVGGLGLSYLGQQEAADQAAAGRDASMIMGREQLAESARRYDQSREDTRPWREAGEQALVGLAGGIQDLADYQFEFDADELGQTDAYKWRRDQGLQAADRAMIASRGSIDGGRVQGLMELGGMMASQEFEAEHSRQLKTSLTNYGFRSDHLNRLASVAGLGQSSTGILSQMATSLNASDAGVTGNMMRTATGAGDAQAAATMGMTNTGINFLNDLAYGGTDWFGGSSVSGNEWDDLGGGYL